MNNQPQVISMTSILIKFKLGCMIMNILMLNSTMMTSRPNMLINKETPQQIQKVLKESLIKITDET